jgi:HEAT repeat protein
VEHKVKIRTGAAAALGRIGPAAAAAVPALIERLADQDSSGKPAGQPMANALDRIRPAWRNSEEAKQFVRDLTERLAGEDGGQRHAIVWALGTIGPPASPTRPALLRLLGDSSAEVRRAAAVAVGAIGPRAEDVRALAEHLGDPFSNHDRQDEQRRELAKLLGKADRKWRDSDAAKEALAVLTHKLGEDAEEVRRGAIRGLGHFGPAAVSALARLIPCLGLPSAHVRQDAYAALNQIDSNWPSLKTTTQYRQIWMAEAANRRSPLREPSRDALRLLDKARGATAPD